MRFSLTQTNLFIKLFFFFSQIFFLPRFLCTLQFNRFRIELIVVRFVLNWIGKTFRNLGHSHHIQEQFNQFTVSKFSHARMRQRWRWKKNRFILRKKMVTICDHIFTHTIIFNDHRKKNCFIFWNVKIQSKLFWTKINRKLMEKNIHNDLKLAFLWQVYNVYKYENYTEKKESRFLFAYILILFRS